MDFTICPTNCGFLGLRPKDKVGWSWREKSDLISLPNISPTVALSFKLVEFFLNEMLPSSVKKSLGPYFKQSKKLLKSQEKKNNLSSWASKVRIVPRTQPLLPAEVNPQTLHTVYQALLEEKQISAQYKRRDGEIYRYGVLHPLRLVFRHNVIYLVATIKDYSDLKQFALHRFKKCQLIEKNLTKLDGFNLDNYIATGAFDYTDSDNEFKLVAIFSKQAAMSKLLNPNH